MRSLPLIRRRTIATTLGALTLGLAGAPSASAQRVPPQIAPPQAPPQFTPPQALAQLPTVELPVPPLLAPTIQGRTKQLSLTMRTGESEFLPGRTTPTMGFNGPYLGPTIRIAQGDTVQLAITNRLGTPTTVHWHGMHLPSMMDGGPYQVIAPDETWRPAWIVRQPATSLWYHPHLMGATAAQVGRGLAGMLILDDADPAQQALPHTYGVDDLPLILQDQAIGPQGQPAGQSPAGPAGRGPRTIVTLVNGAVQPSFAATRPRLRLRLLNASSARIYSLGFADGRAFTQVGSDGGLLPAPASMTRLTLGPAERAEIVVDVADLRAGDSAQFQSLPAGGRGGPFGGPPGGPFGANQAGNLLTIVTTGALSSGGDPASPLPARLTTVARIDPATAAVTRDMILGTSGRRFTINGHSMTSVDDGTHDESTLHVRLGDTEIWRIVNRTGATHLFHVHSLQFQVLDRNGEAPPANEAGWKDTVLVRPGETVRIIASFLDYADSNTPFMFHCHILNHEDGGMMGQFLVLLPGATPATHVMPDGSAMTTSTTSLTPTPWSA